MCFSAEASFTTAALLIPAGAAAMARAWRVDKRFIPLCTLPLMFGAQQLMEGMVWVAGAAGTAADVERYSLAYIFFSWMVWPIWVPVSVYFLEPAARRPLYLAFAIGGSMLGGLQFVPYLTHEGWLMTTFLEHAIAYRDLNLLDPLISREGVYALYVIFIAAPLLVSTRREAQIFGMLVLLALAITYSFFAFAYISAFCMGGAIMSAYLVAMIFRKGLPQLQTVKTPLRAG